MGSRAHIDPDRGAPLTGGRESGPAESLRSRLLRWRFNLFPAYRRSGARITFLAADFSEVRIRLPLDWRTRNYVGTLFGGSMFAAVDPVYMVLLIHRLPRDYRIWVKEATIRFLRPARGPLFARLRLEDGEVAAIRAALEEGGRLERPYHVELADRDGSVHATVEQTLHISRLASVTSGPGRAFMV